MILSRRCLPPEPAPAEAGFTLIELIISLALFALIGVAGVALVDGTLNTGTRTEGRLDRLAELQRAAFLLTSDLDQVAQGPISGTGDRISFRRHGLGVGAVAARVDYRLDGGALLREVGGVPGVAMTQSLISGVTAVRWRFYDPGGGWADRWPPSPEQQAEWPSAVAIELVLGGGAGPAGTMRRVVALADQP